LPGRTEAVSTQDNTPIVDAVVIGHFAKDSIIYRGKEQIASGGSVYYGALTIRRLGLRVAVITRLAPADFPRLGELEEAGILVYAQAAEQTSGIENTYLTEDMDRRRTRPLGFAGSFCIEDVPDIEAKLWLIGPIMAGEVDMSLLRAISAKGPVALDAQGFVRVREGDQLLFRDWPEKRAGLPYVRYLKVDSAEAEVLTGRTAPREATMVLAGFGVPEVVLTHAQGVLVLAGGAYYEAPFTPREIRGRTGRGDTCFAAYLAKRLSAPPGEACRFAALVASRKLEAPGPLRGFEDRMIVGPSPMVQPRSE
jgi:sugar/nucleoside kinase (ribokinase family)